MITRVFLCSRLTFGFAPHSRLSYFKWWFIFGTEFFFPGSRDQVADKVCILPSPIETERQRRRQRRQEQMQQQQQKQRAASLMARGLFLQGARMAAGDVGYYQHPRRVATTTRKQPQGTSGICEYILLPLYLLRSHGNQIGLFLELHN